MKKTKDIFENIEQVVLKGAKTIIPVLCAGIIVTYVNKYDYVFDRNAENYIHSNHVTFSDAIKTIENSDMFSVHKREAMHYIPTNLSDDVYSAIIIVAKSDMFSVHKLDSIKNICRKAYNEKLKEEFKE